MKNLKDNVDREKFEVFADMEVRLHVAIKIEYYAQINKAFKKYKEGKYMPDDLVVPGIYMQNVSLNEIRLLDENELERDIKIKNLMFRDKSFLSED